jgi:hypothetical protein
VGWPFFVGHDTELSAAAPSPQRHRASLSPRGEVREAGHSRGHS